MNEREREREHMQKVHFSERMLIENKLNLFYRFPPPCLRGKTHPGVHSTLDLWATKAKTTLAASEDIEVMVQRVKIG